jgi:hypothetical protein
MSHLEPLEIAPLGADGEADVGTHATHQRAALAAFVRDAMPIAADTTEEFTADLPDVLVTRGSDISWTDEVVTVAGEVDQADLQQSQPRGESYALPEKHEEKDHGPVSIISCDHAASADSVSCEDTVSGQGSKPTVFTL